MIIRQAVEADIDKIIIADKSQEDLSHDYDEELYRYYIGDEDTIVLLALENNNKVSGVLIMDDSANVIFHFFVVPELRKKGTGNKLLESALAVLDTNQTDISLDVDADKKDAQKLYKRFSFQACKKRGAEQEHLSLTRKPFAHLKY